MNYSQAKAVAERINQDFNGYEVLAAGISAIDAPSGYLGRPVWSLHEGKKRRYYSQRKQDCTLSERDLPLLLTNLEKYKLQLPRFALIVSLNPETIPLRDYLMANQDITRLWYVQNYEGAIEPMENYYLFVYQK
jgi:hypothetical protein